MRKRSLPQGNAGFTLVEMLVSVALFSIVVTVGIGALLTVLAANRKAQALQSVMNNLNFTLEQMSRDVRVGTSYDCGGQHGGPHDCGAPQSTLEYVSHTGDKVVYELNVPSDDTKGAFIERSVADGPFQRITSADITIRSLSFYVTGSSAGDLVQPKVQITIQGHTGDNDQAHAEANTNFNLQTTIVSRHLDR